MRLKSKALFSVGGGVAAVALMVLGIPTSANAVLGSYYYGSSFENQTHSSSTVFMSGGNIYTDPMTPVFNAVGVVSGVGTYTGGGSTDFNFAGRTTYQYCKWDFGGGSASDIINLACRYRY